MIPYYSWFDWTAVDWVKVGRNILCQLPKHEHQPFIQWLERNHDMLELYADFPGRALKAWKDSIVRYEL